MRRVAACWVPYLLTREQRDRHIEIYHKRLKGSEDEWDVMGHVITGEGRWISHFDPVIKEGSVHWKFPQSPVKKKVC